MVGGMKLPILASIILAGSFAHAGSIVQKPLDEFIIYDLPVASKTGTTTVMFPSEISGLFAKSVAVQDQENAGFLISFTPGNFYFTIRALQKGAEDHLTVIFNRKAYVFHLTASDHPFYNVTLYQEERSGKEGRINVVPERILSLMDKAKAYPLLLKADRDGLAGVAHRLPLSPITIRTSTFVSLMSGGLRKRTRSSSGWSWSMRPTRRSTTSRRIWRFGWTSGSIRSLSLMPPGLCLRSR